MNDQKRPQGDGYYWYKPGKGETTVIGLDHDDWQPIEVEGDAAWFIGDRESQRIEDLRGTFVKAGKPIPFLGTIRDGELILHDETEAP